MKILNIKITLCSLLSILFLAPLQAQDNKTEGPSLEETVEYINKILSTSIGRYFSEKEDEVIKQKFSLDEVTIEEKSSWPAITNGLSTIVINYNNISWEALESFKEKKDGSLIFLELFFKLQLNYTRIVTDDLSHFYNRKATSPYLIVLVVPDKVENIKKAFLHLKKLMHKDDPFD